MKSAAEAAREWLSGETGFSMCLSDPHNIASLTALIEERERMMAEMCAQDSRRAAIREVIELMGTWRTQYAADGWGHIADAFTHRISSLRSHFADELKKGT